MSASRARASVQQPAAADRLSETLRTVAADPAPANTAGRSAADIDSANARWQRGPSGREFLLAALAEDHATLLQNAEYLLCSIADASREDGDHAKALSDIGCAWVAQAKEQFASVKQHIDAAYEAMAEEAQA